MDQRFIMSHLGTVPRDDEGVTEPGWRDLLRTRAMADEPRCGGVRLVCVDGPAGSGKTTFAAELAALFGDAPVVHLDDLYRGWTQPLGELPERIRAWLLDPWSDGLAGRYPRYDWYRERYVEWVEVPPAPVVVLEGCGSAAGAIRVHANLVAWIEADPEACLARGLARDGAGLRAQWEAWQESESIHFQADGTREAADVHVITADAGALPDRRPGSARLVRQISVR